MSLHLFDAIGIELEYMIVSQRSLSVMPLADHLLRGDDGMPQIQVEHGPIAWSNELALHVIELKTNGPTPTLDGVAARFAENVSDINRRLEPLGAMLMPTAMHPWMNPHHELRLWPHRDDIIYKTFDRIFDCRGHGWANLQSMHINLPFTGDDELARLHAAIRLILPILPGLAASSPLIEGALTGTLDNRVRVYASNARNVPSVTGAVIPEAVRTRADYQRIILDPIYADLAPHDPARLLCHEWVNARGAIARFDRGAIEIRLLDVQECPASDLAVCAAVVSVVRALVEERLCEFERQLAFPLRTLKEVLDRVSENGERALLGENISEFEYLQILGCPRKCNAGELWNHLVDATLASGGANPWQQSLDVILTEGCLARRIVNALGGHGAVHLPPREQVAEVYRELCRCLADNRMFTA